MKPVLTDIIDSKILKRLIDLLYRATRIPLAVFTPEGKLLATTGLQKFCVTFHHDHPGISRRCRECSSFINTQLIDKQYYSYTCDNGFRDIAVRVIIEDDHVATLHFGPFLYDDEPPDRAEFQRQVESSGVDVAQYLAELDEIPLLSHERVDQLVADVLAFVDTLVEMGLKEVRLKESEQALRKSESWLHLVQRITNMGMYEHFYESGETIWSDEVFDITRRDQSLGVPTKEEYDALIHPDDIDAFFAEHERSYRERDRFDLVYRIVPDTGEIVTLHSSGQVLYDDTDTPRSFFGIVIDITEQQKAIEQIEASLNEKEALLREIHHRVKNNLQIISSLLMLQRDRTNNTEQHEVFNISINRIRTMSLVHEHLYRSDNVARIDAYEYIKHLCEHITQQEKGSREVTVVFNIDDISLSMDIAIPCGLMINELVTNALHHGIGDNQNGLITVSMHCIENRYALSVSDSGVGISTDFDWHQVKTLGLHLVGTLAEQQLGGSFALTGPEHAEFTIMFPSTC